MDKAGSNGVCTMAYEPTAVDVAWAKESVALTSDEGVLAYKSPRLIYRVHHDVKVMILENPELLPKGKREHQRTRVIFAAIGWTVLPDKIHD